MRRRRYLSLTLGTAVGLPLAGCQARPPKDDETDTPVSPTTGPVPGTTTADPPEDGSTADINRPVLFLSPTEATAIAERVAARDEPWWSAFRELERWADDALGAVPLSVVDNGAPQRAGGDSHRYGTDAPYQRTDGEFAPEANREDYQVARRMAIWIRDLGLAYALTESDQYAEKAVELLAHWFVDPDTRMYPSERNFGPHTAGLNGQNSIEHFITLPAMFYGASLVAGHPAWQAHGPNAEASLTDWVRTFLADLEATGYTGSVTNNIYAWWVLTRASAAAFVGDDATMARAFDDWRTTALDQLDDQGSLRYERSRTRGLFYSLYGLQALATAAELARHHGVDLYGYQRDGRSAIRRICDFHAPYLLDPSTWPYGEKDGLSDTERREAVAPFELAYSLWRDEEYLAVLDSSGRPIRGSRILGYDTLTHGNGFDLA